LVLCGTSWNSSAARPAPKFHGAPDTVPDAQLRLLTAHYRPDYICGQLRQMMNEPERYKGFPIYGFAIPVFGSTDLWFCRGLVFAPDDTRTVEIERIEGPIDLKFSTREEAEQHGLKLCREWIDRRR
jgi:hypothetical protein